MLQQTLHLLFEFIKTPIGNWTVLGLTLVVILAILYDRNRQIPGLSVEQIIEDTWFVTRDDNRKLAIFISLEFTNNDGGPARGGEFIMALSPQLIAGNGWNEHAEKFFHQMTSLEGVRLPGQRRHNNRKDEGPRKINSELVEKIKKLGQ